MSEMVEKVSAALAQSFKDTVAAGCGKPFEETGVSLPACSIWERYALAAIEAMRNFTDAMVEAGEKADEDYAEASPNRACFMIWTAMIDAALKE